MTSRRIFLKSGAMAMLSLGFAPSFLGRAAAAVGARRKLLIAIFQRGAVDGLNMIVPHGEADYYRLRPTIAIPQPGARRDGLARSISTASSACIRAMAPLKPLWDNRSLAIVHACGSPDNTRSHFDAQDYMESATPGVKATRDGWLNRYLQVVIRGAQPASWRRAGADDAAIARGVGRRRSPSAASTSSACAGRPRRSRINTKVRPIAS